MDSDDEQDRSYYTPEVYEHVVWPEIRDLERHFRRTDRLFFAAQALVLLLLTSMAALYDPPWTGFFTGAAVVNAFIAGHSFKGVQGRRAGYRQLEQLHEQAELILLHREIES